MENQGHFEKIFCPELDHLDPNISSTEYLQAYHYANNPCTYFENGDIQCGPNRRRSLIDLYSLLKTRYPEYTYTELGEDLYYLREFTLSKPSTAQKGFIIFVCNVIHRVVVSNKYNLMPDIWIVLYFYDEVISVCRDTIEDPEYYKLIKNLIAIEAGEVSPDILIGIIPEKSFQRTILTER